MRRTAIACLAGAGLLLGACAGAQGPLPRATAEAAVAPDALGTASGELFGILDEEFGWGSVIGFGGGPVGGYVPGGIF